MQDGGSELPHLASSRALTRAAVPATPEPFSLSETDKRPDNVTLISWE
jgi:hypothetical protein